MRLSLPGLSAGLTEIVVITVILLVLAMFAPLYGAVVSLLVFWHADRNSLRARRNIAIPCAVLSLFNLVFPDVLYLPHLLPFLVTGHFL